MKTQGTGHFSRGWTSVRVCVCVESSLIIVNLLQNIFTIDKSHTTNVQQGNTSIHLVNPNLIPAHIICPFISPIFDRMFFRQRQKWKTLKSMQNVKGLIKYTMDFRRPVQGTWKSKFQKLRMYELFDFRTSLVLDRKLFTLKKPNF